MEAQKQRGRGGMGGTAPQGQASARTVRKVPVEAPVMGDDLLDLASRDVVTGVLPRGGRLCITGEDGMLATNMLIQLAVSASVGIDWLGMGTNAGRVLIVCLTADRPEIRAAILELQQKTGASRELVAQNLALSVVAGHYLDAVRLADDLVSTFGNGVLDLVVLEGAHVLVSHPKEADGIRRLEAGVTRLASHTGAAVAYASSVTRDAWASVVDIRKGPGGSKVAYVERRAATGGAELSLRNDGRMTYCDDALGERRTSCKDMKRENLERAIEEFMGGRSSVDRKAFCDSGMAFKDPRTIQKYLAGSKRFESVSDGKSAIIRRIA